MQLTAREVRHLVRSGGLKEADFPAAFKYVAVHYRLTRSGGEWLICVSGVGVVGKIKGMTIAATRPLDYAVTDRNGLEVHRYTDEADNAG